jgi:protein-tyrosine-phosphatase
MAERLFTRAAAGRHSARSAGADPHGTGAEPNVVEALAEIEIDASDHVQRKLSSEDIEWADVVIATCSGVCPVIVGKRYENWGIDDPLGLPVEQVRAIRDEIAAKTDALSAELG